MKLTHPHVRHLYWSICSQELAFVSGVEPLPALDQQQIASWCEQLQRDPTPLHHYIEQREHRLLGSYFEVLWQFFFTHYPEWQLLGSRIQIPPTGPTQGELDILCQPPLGAPLHVELAVKVYLRHPDHSGLANEHWLGPRTNDRLDLKLNKLEQKQFRMLEHAVTQQTLEAANLPKDAHPASVIKGYLFEPFLNPDTDAFPIAASANPDCNKGHWIHAQNIEQLTTQHDRWQIVDKWQWLGPLWQQDEPMTSAEVNHYVANHFTQPNYALMLIALTPDAQGWNEQQRFMVINDSWPYQCP